jgi:hypothetical protein
MANFVPGAIAGIITGGIGAAAVAAAEIYRAYTIEKNWINKVENDFAADGARGTISLFVCENCVSKFRTDDCCNVALEVGRRE